MPLRKENDAVRAWVSKPHMLIAAGVENCGTDIFQSPFDNRLDHDDGRTTTIFMPRLAIMERDFLARGVQAEPGGKSELVNFTRIDRF